MKIKLSFYYNNNETEHKFNASLKDQRFYFEDSVPFLSNDLDANKRILIIEDYRISNQLMHEMGYDVNTRFKTSCYNRPINVYSKFNWIQKQRIKFMLGDHYLQQEGNFKWLIGGMFSVFAFIITFNITNQSSKIDTLKKEQEQLKDSIRLVLQKVDKAQNIDVIKNHKPN